MPAKHRNCVLILCLSLWCGLFLGNAQDTPTPKSISIIAYIQQLEKDFDIKFSFADEDLQTILIIIPRENELPQILLNIQEQTQLIIERLNERYYTITKSTTVDICARVLDNFKENTIPGASVEVIDTENITITDSAGRFFLQNVPRKAVLRIRHLGYKTKFVVAEDHILFTPCKSILLAINYQELEEVVVFEYLTSGIVKQLDAGIEINTREFGILPGLIEPDVLQTVQALPGIKSIDETVSDINIRGGTNDQNLIMWDGIKMYQSGHFFGLISAFNPYLTEMVIITKNGTSAEYGDGISGIIDIQTTNTIQDDYFWGAGFNLLAGDLYGYFPVNDKLAFQFSARRSVTDFLDTPTYDVFRDRAFQNTEIKKNSNQQNNSILQEEDFYFYDFNGKILYDINDTHKARLSFININNKLDYTETNNDTGRSNQSTLDQENLSIGGSLESNWSNTFSTTLNAYYTKYNLEAGTITSNGTQQLFQNNNVLEKSIKLKSHYTLSNKLNWLNGYQFAEVGIENRTNLTQPPFDSDIKGVMRTHALFTEMKYETEDKKLNASGGARFNYIENLETFTEFIIEPRLNVNFFIADYLRAELLGEFKHQTTNQIIDLEQNFLGIEKRRWTLSDNQFLPVTKSKQGSAGLNYDQRSWFIGLEAFYKEVTGVSTETQGFQNQNQFNGEIGKYDVKGIEFLVNHKYDDFSSWLSYTYNINEYTFKDLIPSTFPNNLDIRHSVTLAGTYSYEDFKIGIGLNYRTGKAYTEPQEGANGIDTTVFPNTINYQDPNSSRLQYYLRADVSGVYDFEVTPSVNGSIGVSVLNFLDKENLLNQYYRLNDQNEIETIVSKSLGITPNLSFRVRF